MFGGGRRAPRKGQDLQTESTITFRESVFGTNLDLRLTSDGGVPTNITVRVPAGVKNGGKIRIRGKQGGRAYEREIEVNLPAMMKENAAVPAIWARRKIDALSVDESENRASITQLGLAYGLMTSFTSYYAVEERVVNEGGQMRRIEVPVEMPEGVSHEGVFGAEGRANMQALKSIQVNKGLVMRRFMPKARGRASRYAKTMSIVSLELGTLSAPVKKIAKKASKKTTKTTDK